MELVVIEASTACLINSSFAREGRENELERSMAAT
jgi:hypothetical protein